MRVGLLLSFGLHSLIIGAGLVNLNSARQLEDVRIDSVPVEILSEEVFSQVTRGSETAALMPDEQNLPSAGQSEIKLNTATQGAGNQDADVSAEKPNALATPVASAPPPPSPPSVEESVQPNEVAAPLPPEEPAPQENISEAEPEEVKPAPKDWAKLAPPQPAQPPKKVKKEKPKKVQKKAKQPKKTKKPKKAIETAALDHASKKKKFDRDRIAALLNKSDRGGGGGANDQRAQTRGRPQGLDSRLTQSELDKLRRQIARCWNPPVGAAGAADLIVRVRIDLNKNGSLSRSPSIVGGGTHPFFASAADSALRAILRCAPYSMPAHKYTVWKAVSLTFNPREMM